MSAGARIRRRRAAVAKNHEPVEICALGLAINRVPQEAGCDNGTFHPEFRQLLGLDLFIVNTTPPRSIWRSPSMSRAAAPLRLWGGLAHLTRSHQELGVPGLPWPKTTLKKKFEY
jgi:hypothetical protein